MEAAAAAQHYQNPNQSRGHERRTVNVSALALSTEEATLRQLSGPKVLVTDVSEGGAAIKVSDPTEIPDWFYLDFPDIGTRVTCFVVGRSSGRINAQFSKEISPSVIDEIQRLAFEQSFDSFDEVLRDGQPGKARSSGTLSA